MTPKQSRRKLERDRARPSAFARASKRVILERCSPKSLAASAAVLESSEFKIDFEDGSSATLRLADPGLSVVVRDKNHAVEYLG